MIRVAIADDEILECEALEKMLKQNFPSAEVLPPVLNGVALVEQIRKENPDIAIVDINMPGLDGLCALEMLRAENVRMEVIIHTAYSQFDYIHKALKLGAFDYLVKPVFEEDFTSVFASVLKIAEERQKTVLAEKVLETENVGDLLEENVMMSILLKRPDEKIWGSLMHTWDITQGEFLMLMLRNKQGAFSENVRAKLEKEAAALCHCAVLVYEQSCYCLLAAQMAEGRETLFSRIKKWFPEFVRKQRVYGQQELCGGVSAVKHFLSEVPTAAEEAEAAMNHASEYGTGFYQHKERKAEENILIGLAGDMADDIAKGKTDRSLQRLGERLREKGKKEISFTGRFYGMELVSEIAILLDMDRKRCGICWFLPECVRRMFQGGSKSDSAGCTVAMETESLMHEAGSWSVEEFLGYMEKEIRELQECLAVSDRKPNDYVERAMLCLERQYMRQELSMDEVAEQLGITSFYLSRLFKQEKNATFLEILTEIRITKALRFLMDPSRSIQSVAAMCGYQTKYFYRVFRSTVGLSQGEFREAVLTESDGK